MNSKLLDVFKKTKSENRAALIAYVPAGFPTVLKSIELIQVLVANGADIVEIGFPYSDPLMDGPTIQAAVEIALQNGTKSADVLKVVEATSQTGAATLVMSYWNPIAKFGVEKFASELAKHGGIGVITPDLTPEEATSWIQSTNRHAIDRVFLVAPSSSDVRIKSVTAATTGFVYAASLMGVTGVKSAVSQTAADLVARTREATDLPVCVGLGVSTQTQAREIAKYADGVIVGSAFIHLILSNPLFEQGLEAVARLTRDLAQGIKRI